VDLNVLLFIFKRTGSAVYFWNWI